MKKSIVVLGLAATFAITLVVYAAVTFDPATGTGFVGKGDVQLIYGWNNAQLQANAGLVQFRATTVSERSWECKRINPQGVEITQERERTTTSTQLVSKIDRVRNQITGFILDGYTGAPSTTIDGPALNSCPSASAGWFLSVPAGDPVVIASGVAVSINGADWFDLN